MPEATQTGKKIKETDVRLIRGDLTMLEVDAVVFYAQPDLKLGSGFGTALSVRGGPAIQKELEGKGPLETGKAIATTGGNLKATRVIHAVGPRFQEEDMDGKLRATVKSALKCAEEAGCASVAFPPMGAGFYGVPLPDCAKAMLETIREHLQGGTKLREIVICAMDSREFQPFEACLNKL